MTAVKKPQVGNPNFVKGMESPNPRGRPRGTGSPISPLRRTFNTSQKNETLAQEIVTKVLNGTAVKKDQQDMAKWLLSFLVSTNRAASQDEAQRLAARLASAERDEEEKDDGAKDEDLSTPPVFKLEVVRDYDHVFDGVDREELSRQGYSEEE